MLYKVKKHINKILVFALNFLLMAIAILVIKEKDQARLSEKKQNDLLIDNSSLSDENAVLRGELQSFKGILKGVLESSESILTGEKKNVPVADPSPPAVINNSTPDNTVKKSPSNSNASSSTKNNNSNSSTSNSSASPSPTKKIPSSNSQTKTS
jgi:hypothetical protein